MTEADTHIRRGLPRVAGGKPWPPTLVTPIPVVAVQDITRQVTSNSVSEKTARHETDVQVTIPPKSAPDVGESHLTGADQVQRRGLPRTHGAEAWPALRARPPRRSSCSSHNEPSIIHERRRVDAEPKGALTTQITAETAEPGVRQIERPRGARPDGEVPSAPAPTRRLYRGHSASAWVLGGCVAGSALVIVCIVAVLLVRWLVKTQAIAEFIIEHPGEYDLPISAPLGIPMWLNWAHFFNLFLMIMIIRSGIQIRREKRPAAMWAPRWNPDRKVSLTVWFHQTLDLLWIINGAIYVILLVVTGQWMRVVPTSWAVFPNALSALLQYFSLDWPTENGWVNYNSLQQLAYFGTVFIAAPLAMATGIRMSGLWPATAPLLNRLYPIELARKIHFPVMLYFIAFIAMHVSLVLATGMLRNLNHMYASQDAVNWTGFLLFLVTILLMATASVASRPALLAPIAALMGRVGR